MVLQWEHHSITQLRWYKEYNSGTLNNHSRFINNRVNGFHLGIEGQVTTDINYRLKSTYTMNYGSYAEEFLKRYSWTRIDNYFYDGGKSQVYTMMELNWRIPNLKKIQLNGTLAYDFGQLYHSFGGRLGINYTPF